MKPDHHHLGRVSAFSIRSCCQGANVKGRMMRCSTRTTPTALGMDLGRLKSLDHPVGGTWWEAGVSVSLCRAEPTPSMKLRLCALLKSEGDHVPHLRQNASTESMPIPDDAFANLPTACRRSSGYDPQGAEAPPHGSRELPVIAFNSDSVVLVAIFTNACDAASTCVGH